MISAMNVGTAHTNENILLCIICNQALHRPKTLPCLHTCCEDCLREFIFSRAYDAVGQFPCPMCRQAVWYPPGGVASMPDKFRVVGFLDVIPSSKANVSEETSTFSAGGTDLRFCFGRLGSSVTDFVEPVGLALTLCGDVVVSDKHCNRIMTFDIRGRIRGAFSCRHVISGITITDLDTVVVAAGHGEASAIEYNTLTGARLRSFGTLGRLDDSHGVSVLSTPPFEIAVSSCETGMVSLLSDSGRLVRKFAKRSVIGKPFHMASTSRGELVLSDHVNNRVCIVDRVTGDCLVQMGIVGTGRNSLYQPLGVAVDDKDNILVADSGNRRVVQFSHCGKFLGVVVDMSRSIGKPVNVACQSGSGPGRGCSGILAVLVTAHDYAQVRIYSYTPSKPCDVLSLGKKMSCCSSSGQAV